MGKKGVHKFVSFGIVILIILGGLALTAELIHLSSKEIMSSDSTFFDQAQEKIRNLKYSLEAFFGTKFGTEDKIMAQILQKDSLGSAFGFIGNFLSMSLTTAFFTVLWLAESINVQKLLNATLLKRKHT